MKPAAKLKVIPELVKDNKKGVKWRRLSRPKRVGGFSTINKPMDMNYGLGFWQQPSFNSLGFYFNPYYNMNTGTSGPKKD